MPSDAGALAGLIGALATAGYTITSVPDPARNPSVLSCTAPDGSTGTYLVHVRRITRQGKKHNRAADELHMQMVFDGDRRGAGVKHHLRGGGTPLLLGHRGTSKGRVWTAFDPSRHQTYAFSKSLQVKQGTLDEAERAGLVLFERTHGEIVVAFREEFFARYLAERGSLHGLSREEFDSIQRILQTERGKSLPAGLSSPAGPRERLVAVVTRLARDARFARAIRSAYQECATCDFPGQEVIQGAHIIPVTDPASSDDYANGLGLCPLCHTLYDKGYLLIDGKGRIKLHSHRVPTGGLLAAWLQSRLRQEIKRPALSEEQPEAAKLARTYRQRAKSP